MQCWLFHLRNPWHYLTCATFPFLLFTKTFISFDGVMLVNLLTSVMLGNKINVDLHNPWHFCPSQLCRTNRQDTEWQTSTWTPGISKHSSPQCLVPVHEGMTTRIGHIDDIRCGWLTRRDDSENSHSRLDKGAIWNWPLEFRVIDIWIILSHVGELMHVP